MDVMPNPSIPSRPTEVRLRHKILIFVVSLTLAVAFATGIYWVATFERLKPCMVCAETDNEFSNLAPLAWWSSWSLITTSVTWGVWVWRRVIKKATPVQGLFLIELSLPLSVVVMVGYTVYIATNGGGADFFDDELCDRLIDSAIPKAGTTEAEKKAYLGFTFLTNMSMHYLSPIISCVLYAKYHERRAWKPFWAIGFIMLIGIAVVLAQEVGGTVIYCTDNIYVSTGITVGSFTVIHALAFFRPFAKSAEDVKDDSGEGDLEMTIGETNYTSDDSKSVEDVKDVLGDGN